MSEHASEGGSGPDMKFFIIFFGLIVFFAIFTRDGNSIFSFAPAHQTSTPQATSNQTVIERAPREERLSDAQIEARVASLYRELDALREDLREAKLREPVSPYAGMVELGSGSARATDPDLEYLTLYASSQNTEPIPVSSWYLESYVTDEVAALPEGDRVLTRWRSPVLENITLLPGEYAYVLTGTSPIDASFHENACTGYLTREETFYPYLNNRCPSPRDELKRAGTIKLDDDTCYDFVDRIGYCAIPSEEAIEKADLTGACRRFIESTFGYNNCVALHKNDPYFDDFGNWYLYLGRHEELWRGVREIIQLKDENDLIVDVIEY